MKTRFIFRAALAAAASLLVGCTNSSSPTEPKVAALSTPTPLPAAGDIAGPWTGRFDPINVIGGCLNGASASASFEQDGPSVVGVLNVVKNDCGYRDLVFQGTLRENVLAGSLNGAGFEHGRANGVLSGGALEITLIDDPEISAGTGRMYLHREGRRLPATSLHGNVP